MRLTVVGSGTLWPDGERGSAAHFVESGNHRVLLDCGSGALHGMARLGLDWQAISHIAITHFHTDHVGDLPALFWAYRVGLSDRRDERLVILGPPGIKRFMRRLARAFGQYIVEPRFPLEIVELARHDRWNDPDGALEVTTHPTPHTDRSVAYRLSGEATIGYTGDTGPDPDLGTFFAGVDALITECAQVDPPAMDTHMSPTTIARLGQAAQPGVIVTTHFYPPAEPDDIPDSIRAAGWPGTVLAGHDGLSISIPDR